MNQIKGMRALQGSLHLVARALSDNLRVEVIVGGERACTDGKKIIRLPSLPLECDKAKVLAFGYISHEAAHLLYTDFRVWHQYVITPIRQHLLNVLEDIRIELEMNRRYPGCQGFIGNLVMELVAEGLFGDAQSANPVSLMQDYLLRQMRFEILGQKAMGPLALETGARLETLIGANLKRRLDELMRQISRAQSTRDACSLAEAILTLFQNELDEASRPHGPGLPSTSAALLPEVEEGHKEGREEGCPGRFEAIKQILAASMDAAQQGLGERAGKRMEELSRSSPSGITLDTPDSRLCEGRGQGDGLIREVKSETKALRRRIQGLLQDRSRSRSMVTSRSGSRIQSRRLYRLRIGDTGIFRRVDDALEPQAAIQILVDRSGSMEGPAFETAKRASAAVALALEGLPHVAVSVAVFPFSLPGQSEGIGVLTRFGEPIRQSMMRYADLEAEGTTPMAPALMWAGLQLAAQQHERKILLVMTDGVPDNASLTRTVIREITACGIEVMALGLHQDISCFFSLNQTLHAISELPQALFHMLGRALIQPGCRLS